MSKFNYFHGGEAESFSFFRIPRTLIKDERFRNLSTEAKLLYGLMLDRMGLSLRNGWLDEEDRVFIFYINQERMTPTSKQVPIDRCDCQQRASPQVKAAKSGLVTASMAFVKHKCPLVRGQLPPNTPSPRNTSHRGVIPTNRQKIVNARKAASPILDN